MENASVLSCRSCGNNGNGNFCSLCGERYVVRRITVSELVHDIFHFFTHLDKGFGYTLKKLLTSPGQMQLDYINGNRARHQKPFSMFFLCATVTALCRYWIAEILMKYYHSGDVREADFFHQYMVITQIAVLPVFMMMTWLAFRKAGYNLAEIGVMILYTSSIFYLAVISISLLKFIWPDLDTAYIELPVLMLYNTVTLVNFFNMQRRVLVVIKGVLLLLVFFMMIQYLETFLVQNLFK